MRERNRRRWTKLVEEFGASKQKQPEFASERGVSVSTLRYWIYRLRNEAEEKKSAALEPTGESLRLLPVRVAGAATMRIPVEVSSTATQYLELALPSGVCIRFRAGADVTYLHALAAAL